MVESVPRVTVVLSAYNAEPFVAESIDTMLAQTFSDFELLAIDDGSTDNTLQVLHECAARDGRVRVIALDRNVGVSAARNIGTREARGELLAVMDADDLNALRRLAVTVEYLDQHPECDIVGTQYIELDNDSGELRHPQWSGHGIRDGAQPAPHSSLLFRRSALEAVGGYDERFHMSQDNELLQRLASRGSEVHVLDEALVTVRRHASNTTRNRRRLAASGVHIIWRLFRDPNLKPTRRAYARGFEYLVKYVYFTLRVDKVIPSSLISRMLGRGPRRFDGESPGA